MTAWLLLSILSVIRVPELPSGWRAGLLALDVDTGEEVLSRNADVLFRPASTMKVVTTLAALERLGPSYVYRTTIHADTVGNRIWLVGSGAPLLSAEDVTRAAMETTAALPGGRDWEFYLDRGCFVPETHLPGWSESDFDKTYCPPVEPLCIGDNVLQIVVSAVGGMIRVYTYPPLPGLLLSWDGVRVGEAGRVTASVSGWHDAIPRIALRGTLARNETVILYKPFAGAPTELAAYLQGEFSRWGLRTAYTGEGEPERGAFVTSTLFSQPLWVLLGSMNKMSRNLLSEQILRTLSREGTGAPGSTRSGCDILGDLLEALLPGVPGWQVADGSGLSRYNLLTPRQLTSVFSHGVLSPTYGPEFLASFPVNGLDGTLSRRMRNLPPGAFRGKTGSLNDTCTLTGILTASSGRRFVVAVMLETPRGNGWSARAWQDSLVEELYRSL